jgi:hypothetical protein
MGMPQKGQGNRPALAKERHLFANAAACAGATWTRSKSTDKSFSSKITSSSSLSSDVVISRNS